MDLSRIVSEIDGNFSRKSLKKIPPLVFCVSAEGVPLEVWYRRWGQKTRVMELPGRQRSLTISSAMWIQCINVTDGRSDGHRATAKTTLTHSVAR